jgi:hypothetical protein
MTEDKKPHPLARALVDIVDAAISDGATSADGDDGAVGISVHDVAANGVKRWGKFARKRDLPYRKELPVAEVLADQRLTWFFETMRQLPIPVHGAAGYLEAEWQGVPFTSFAAYAMRETGALEAFRFVCTPLSRPYPDLTFDLRLNSYPEQRKHLYPRLGEYKKVDGPKPPSKLKPSVLGKVPGIRQARQFVDDFLTYPPHVHTASEAHAAQVAERPYEPLVFKRDWMVRGSWLVMFEEEHIRALGAPDETPKFLDALPHIRFLVDPPGAPAPGE